MAVLLKSIIHTHADAKAVFKDPTGSRCTHTVTSRCWWKHFKLQRNGVKWRWIKRLCWSCELLRIWHLLTDSTHLTELYMVQGQSSAMVTGLITHPDILYAYIQYPLTSVLLQEASLSPPGPVLSPQPLFSDPALSWAGCHGPQRAATGGALIINTQPWMFYSTPDLSAY